MSSISVAVGFGSWGVIIEEEKRIGGEMERCEEDIFCKVAAYYFAAVCVIRARKINKKVYTPYV